jgi:hypothetical protein
MRQQSVSVMHAQTPGEPMPINRVLKFVSFVIAVGASLMVGMLIWSHRLDGDLSGSYACCTQEVVADFHQRFWSRFFVGAKVAIVGCLALAATLPEQGGGQSGIIRRWCQCRGRVPEFYWHKPAWLDGRVSNHAN